MIESRGSVQSKIGDKHISPTLSIDTIYSSLHIRGIGVETLHITSLHGFGFYACSLFPRNILYLMYLAILILN